MIFFPVQISFELLVQIPVQLFLELDANCLRLVSELSEIQMKQAPDIAGYYLLRLT